MFMSGGDQMLRYAARPAPLMDRRWKPNHVELAPSCPRCASPNTKFCYYNNYSLSQPRYFCKSCRRYWTKGGSLRNVPVGGGCRKTRRTTRSPTPGSNSCHDDPSESESGSGHGSSPNSDHPPAGESGGPPSEINLAMVFARFLNQNSEVDPETPEVESAASAETHSDSLDYYAAESLGPDGQQQQQQPQQEDRVIGDVCEGFVGGRATQELTGDGPNSDEFGLPNLVLGGEVDAVHDPAEIAWATSSDHLNYGECSLPNFAWQEFELLQLPPDDPLKISTICDNWSAFDLSGL